MLDPLSPYYLLLRKLCAILPFKSILSTKRLNHDCWISSSNLEACLLLAFILTSLLLQAMMEISRPFIQLKQHPDFENILTMPEKSMALLYFN